MKGCIIYADWRNATWRNECGPVTPRRPEPGFALPAIRFRLRVPMSSIRQYARMSSVNTIDGGLLAHLLGDFPLQSSGRARAKRQASRAYLAHGAVHWWFILGVAGTATTGALRG